ncbi:hypothetical protein I350_06133 [Cryptococcus amylolentus CBS 6273]|uniref:Uncharacterized protein n=1 Tax=Cryptococcus amylolentus CBS 6273 TaxID=1296118 RepID=A0A1E3JR30_9TREE|nr:hypothetical protein I350_06133 [Cryptococcus amylolentus CBS 6273]
MSQADQDRNPIDPSVQDDRSNPPAEDNRSANADPNKETEPRSTPAQTQQEGQPDDPFLSTIPSGSWSRITSEKTRGHLILPSREAMGSLIKNGAPGGQDSETGAHYLELGTYNGEEWASIWDDAPGLKVNSEWSASDMRTELDMYMRRG